MHRADHIRNYLRNHLRLYRGFAMYRPHEHEKNSKVQPQDVYCSEDSGNMTPKLKAKAKEIKANAKELKAKTPKLKAKAKTPKLKAKAKTPKDEDGEGES